MTTEKTGRRIPVNFSREWVQGLISGDKCQTIRPHGKREYRPGDTILCYTDLRKVNTRLRATGTITSVEPITIDTAAMSIKPGHVDVMANNGLSSGEADELARADGFESARELILWMRKQYGRRCMHMNVIKWAPNRKVPGQ